MTSSVLDGDGAGCETPVPPAFSPLTDPAPDLNSTGSCEPSVAPAHDGTHDEAYDPEVLPDAPPTAHHDVTVTATAAAPADSAQDSNPDRRSHALSDPEEPPATGAEAETAAAAAAPAAPEAITDPMHFNSGMDAAVYPSAGAGLGLYSPHPTDILMALARLSAQRQGMALPPSTVRPSQVSLPPQQALDVSDPLLQRAPDGPSTTPHADAPLESFAKLEFADGVFEMTTYAIIIGRDKKALAQARRNERRLEAYQRKVRENEQLGLPPPTPPIQEGRKFSKSYVSEEGGMLGPESDGEDDPRPSKRRKTSRGAASGSGDSQQPEPAGPEPVPLDEEHPTLNRQYVSHTPGAAAVDLSALRPSPYYVPLVPIHSPGPNIASRTKAISRRHLMIEFNQKRGVFEAIPLHKNGFFCEDVLYNTKVVLRSGDRLQIRDVEFVFTINGVPRGKTGAEVDIDEDRSSSRRYSEGGKEMSFDFESSHDPERRSTSPEEMEEAPPVKEDSGSELSEPPEDIPEPEPEKAPEHEVMETIEKDPPAPPPSLKSELPPELYDALGPIPQRKRGPGRPPKNGIMSKREERLRRKAAMELAKKNMPQPPPGEPPVKRKVGRPRKHPLPENAPDRPEKRKYKPRKPKNGEDGEGSNAEKTMKERRREKPKTPPLELNEADYTEEQRQKPPKNYGTLIDEVLSAAPGGLTLKQIYKRIQMKYPYFYFHVESKGWESSVRHNLIGNDAFRKNEETHLWSRVPGIDIDAGKKRKAASPDRPAALHTFGPPYAAPATATSQTFHAEAGSQPGYRPGTVPQRTGYPPAHGQVGLGQPPPQAQPGGLPVAASAQQAPRHAYSAPAPPAPAVTEQLTKRTRGAEAAEAIALSVIHRGLGLTAESMVPEAESLEEVVFGVFESTSKNLGANRSLHPGLLQALVKFKANMIQTLEGRMKGKRNAERLILSAMDRVLGFTDRSTMPGTETERNQYEAAENVLITAIERVQTFSSSTNPGATNDDDDDDGDDTTNAGTGNFRPCAAVPIPVSSNADAGEACRCSSGASRLRAPSPVTHVLTHAGSATPAASAEPQPTAAAPSMPSPTPATTTAR
ncbi:1e212df0-589d-4e2e-b351-d8f8a29aa673 [Thermothielavioides terrestris]|uniref:1e212df0-589d-4e2e-b351-d8f8a29aa673 n=1 Tax=Thermothielavioides terrestris TaxID=2587410 RepID=A0A3S5CWU9_9PEZI|nr:1e212df0-589d-4e2e-b351-d8f8a29aa673 [Thermothielavioides terrestris]